MRETWSATRPIQFQNDLAKKLERWNVAILSVPTTVTLCYSWTIYIELHNVGNDNTKSHAKTRDIVLINQSLDVFCIQASTSARINGTKPRCVFFFAFLLTLVGGDSS